MSNIKTSPARHIWIAHSPLSTFGFGHLSRESAAHCRGRVVNQFGEDAMERLQVTVYKYSRKVRKAKRA